MKKGKILNMFAVMSLFMAPILAMAQANDERNLPGTATAPSQAAPQTSYQSAEVKPLDLDNMYTIQLAALTSLENALQWVKQQQLNTTDVGIAHTYANDKESYIVATGVFNSFTLASDSAVKFCQENKLNGCWVRNLAKIEALTKAAKQLPQTTP